MYEDSFQDENFEGLTSKFDVITLATIPVFSRPVPSYETVVLKIDATVKG